MTTTGTNTDVLTGGSWQTYDRLDSGRRVMLVCVSTPAP